MRNEPQTSAGREGLRRVLCEPARALLAFDYDGTLAPIVADSTQAWPDTDVIEGLVALSARVGLVAVVTGRPAQVAVDLAGLADETRLERFVVVGHYGMERWKPVEGLRTVDPPAGLGEVRRRLPELLMSLGLSDADVEDKGLSVAVHVRRLADPAAAFAAMEAPLRALADEYGLVAEPGRLVMEMRPAGMDKGQALRALVHETDAAAVMFTGDDLGDLAAFDEVERQRVEGIGGLLVCSGSDEVVAVAARADVVVDGPAGVAEFVADLIQALDDA
ncbi:MAG: trehalose-phosphatase [Nocardioidaceae bacterium]